MNEKMAIYDNIDEVKAGTERLPFLTAGEYLLEVEGLGLCGAKDEYFRAIHKVLEAEGDDATPVGSRTVYLLGEDEYDYGPKDLIWYLRALTNNPRLEVTEETVKRLVANSALAAGTQLKVTVEPKTNKKGEVTRFLKYQFSFVSAPDQKAA